MPIYNEYGNKEYDEKNVFYKIFQFHDNKLFIFTIGIFYE